MASSRQASRLLGRRISVIQPKPEDSSKIAAGVVLAPNKQGLFNTASSAGQKDAALVVGAARSKDEALLVRTGPILWAIR